MTRTTADLLAETLSEAGMKRIYRPGSCRCAASEDVGSVIRGRSWRPVYPALRRRSVPASGQGADVGAFFNLAAIHPSLRVVCLSKFQAPDGKYAIARRAAEGGSNLCALSISRRGVSPE